MLGCSKICGTLPSAAERRRAGRGGAPPGCRRGALAWACALAAAVFAGTARADWTWNVGYHNPVDATYGLNLQYLGSQWGFEVGVGWVDVHSDKQPANTQGTGPPKPAAGGSGTTVGIGGDVDLKYFLSAGKVRPYLTGGVGVGFAAGNGGAGLGAGGGFVGLGLMVGSPAVYGYGSYDLNGARDGFVQAGLGFGL